MKKFAILVVTLIMLAIPLQPVKAAYPSSYSSTVNVTNTTSGDGVISLTFYNSAGVAVYSFDEDIAGYETKYITSFGELSSSFDGSLVISSSVALASLSMLQGKNSVGSVMNYASYIGTSIGSADVYLPLLMKNNYGYNTYFYVQNTSGSPIDVDITYTDGTSNTTIRGLASSAAVKIDNRLESHSTLSFSAHLVVTGGTVAVAVVEYSSGDQGDQLYAYSGFPSGSVEPIFPMINENNYGYWTSANIQNTGEQSTTVTVTYMPTQAGTLCTETQTIPAHGKRDFATYAFAWDPKLYTYSVSTNCARYQKFIGTAVVTANSNNQPLVGIVNQINNADDPNKGAALMSLNPDNGTDTVVFPNIQQWVGSQQWWTSWNIINVSDSNIAAGEIVCTVSDSGTSRVFTNPTSLADGKGWLQQFYRSGTPLPNGFIGGAVCTTTTGAKIVGSANILAANAGIAIDSLAVYEGINP